MQKKLFDENQMYGGDFYENQVHNSQTNHTEIMQGGVPDIHMTYLPCGALQETYQHPLQVASDEPVNWDIASHDDFITEGLPPGLSLDPQTGIIVGIPTESGYYNFTVKASNIHGYATQDMSMRVLSEDEQNQPRYHQLSFDLGGWDDVYPSHIDPILVREGTEIYELLSATGAWQVYRNGYDLVGWNMRSSWHVLLRSRPGDMTPPSDDLPIYAQGPLIDLRPGDVMPQSDNLPTIIQRPPTDSRPIVVRPPSDDLPIYAQGPLIDLRPGDVMPPNDLTIHAIWAPRFGIGDPSI